MQIKISLSLAFQQVLKHELELEWGWNSPNLHTTNRVKDSFIKRTSTSCVCNGFILIYSRNCLPILDDLVLCGPDGSSKFI